MSKRNALKSRLAAEVATVVFGEEEVPSAAWERLDRLVEETFGEAPTGRICSLVDDVGEVRAREGRIESLMDRSQAPREADEDWESLLGVIDEAIHELDPERYAHPDDEASGARTLELVSHGRR